jgi:hypothetical protein
MPQHKVSKPCLQSLFFSILRMPKAMNFPLVYGRQARTAKQCKVPVETRTTRISQLSMIGRSPDCKLYTYGMYVGAHQRTPSRVVLPSRRRCVILALLPELGSSCASGTQHGHAYAYSTRSSIYTKHGRSNNHPRTARGHTHTHAGRCVACLLD